MTTELLEALKDANDKCRSAFQIAKRITEQHGEIALGTNFGAFRDRVHESLMLQHVVLNAYSSHEPAVLPPITAEIISQYRGVDIPLLEAIGDEPYRWTQAAAEFARLVRGASPPCEPCPARLREALEIIAGLRQCVDNKMGNKDVALAALRDCTSRDMALGRCKCLSSALPPPVRHFTREDQAAFRKDLARRANLESGQHENLDIVGQIYALLVRRGYAQWEADSIANGPGCGCIERGEANLDCFRHGVEATRPWRLIEDAPRGYTPILLMQDGSVGEGWYSNHLDTWEFANSQHVMRRAPTHWMPLPASSLTKRSDDHG